MLIHPWDRALSREEWQAWLAARECFGTLVVNNLEPNEAPLAVPTHFTCAGDTILLHLARPNPIWEHLSESGRVRLVVVDDYSYIPSYWRAKPGAPEGEGVPTSYYSSVQFVCRGEIVDQPSGKAAILRAQLADLQPEGRHEAVSADDGPFARMLSGIRGLRLPIERVEAKFKFDDHREPEARSRIADKLEERATGRDTGASAQQRRRLDENADWRSPGS